MDREDIKKEDEAPELISPQKASHDKLVSYYKRLSKQTEVIKSNGKHAGGISIIIGALLVIFGVFFIGEEFGWYDIAASEPSLLFSAITVITGLAIVFFGRTIFKIVFSLLFIFFILGGLIWVVGGNTVAGLFLTGQVAVEEREVSEFTSIDISGRGNIYLANGSEYSLVLEGDKRALSNISVEISDGTLLLRYDGLLWKFLSYLYSDLNIYLTVDNINSINLTGAYALETNGVITANSLTLNVAGSVELNMDIETGSLRVEINGSGDMKIAGKAETQMLNVTGKVKYEAEDLVSNTAFITVSGLGDIKVRVDEELSVSGTGKISVGYRGEPTISQNDISGSGRIYKIVDNDDEGL